VLHQAEEVGQFFRRDALLIERQDVPALACHDDVVRILDSLGDAFERQHFAEPVTGDERGQLFI